MPIRRLGAIQSFKEERKMTKFKCPCCGFFTLSEKPPGTYEICPVCYWEEDNVQYDDPGYAGGANDVSLNTAKENYKKMGAISLEFVAKTRKPLQSELSGDKGE